VKNLAIKNGLWNAMAQIIGVIAGIFSSIIVVHGLSSEQYGTFSYYLWLAGTIGTIGTLALPSSLTKISSELLGSNRQKEARALAGGVFLLLLTINLLFSVGLLFWALNSPSDQSIFLLIITIFVVPNALGAVLRSTLWSHERYKPVSLITATASVTQLLLIEAVYFAQLGAPGFMAVILSVNIIQAIGLAMVNHRAEEDEESPRLWLPSKTVILHYLRFFAPSSLVLIFQTIVWQRSEIFFLDKLSTRQEIGYYGLAYTSFEMLLALGWALINGFYPAISHDYGAGAWDSIREKVRQAAHIGTLYAVPLSFGGWATLSLLIPLLYGTKMLPAVPVAQILFLSLLPGVLGGVFGMLLNAAGGIWFQVVMGLVLAVINITLDILLIPRYGAIGAAIANSAAQFVYAFLLFLVVLPMYQIALPWKKLGAIIGAGLLATFCVPWLIQFFVGSSGGVVNLLVLGSIICIGAVLYAALTWKLGTQALLHPR
jgi:O-antigen/teichoic acid export membrane protein